MDNNIIKSVRINTVEHAEIILKILNKLVYDFKIDEENEEVLIKIFNYFIGNRLICDKYGISLNKGILLVGGVGTGKSAIMRAAKKYTSEVLKVNSFQWFQASEIIDTVNIVGVQYQDEFAHRFDDRKRANPITCYIDDICAKNETVNNYGTKINAIEQLIASRYIVFNRYGKLTHFSTNIYPSEMGKYYDDRIIDRLVEMCNIIELKGNTRRK